MVRRIFLLVAAASFLLAAVSTASGDTAPTGERVVGHATVEPAYDAETGNFVYLLTPDKAPFPTHVNSHAVSPLFLVEYPPGTNFGTLNCEGVPGNCPDHDGEVAGVAIGRYPSVYGTVPAAIPGHDHLVDTPGSHGDFNVAWEVIEVVFTPKAVADHAITHLTTEAAVDAAVANGYAEKIDLGFAFTCAVVSSGVYQHGTPLG